MGYKCGSCNIDCKSKKEIVEHMVNVHDSPFYEGDERMVELSKAAIQTSKKPHLDKFAEY